MGRAPAARTPPIAARSIAIATDDGDRAARFARIAAAVGATPIRLARDESVPPRASLVIVDADRIVPLAACGPVPVPVIAVASGELAVDQWRAGTALGVRHVHRIDDSDEDLVRRIAEVLTVSSGVVGRVLACIGGRGGAGTSALSVSLATEARRRGEDVVLCDLDRFGAGLDLMVGLDRVAGMRWADLGDGVALGADAGDRMTGRFAEALPAVPGGPGRWSVLGFGPGERGPVNPAVVAAVITAVRGSGALTVADVPRTFDEVAFAAMARADLVLVVTTADVRGCYGAARAVAELAGISAEVGLVVRGPAPTGLAATELAESVGVPLVAAMRPQAHLARDLDLGRLPRGPLTGAAGTVLDHLWGRS